MHKSLRVQLRLFDKCKNTCKPQRVIILWGLFFFKTTHALVLKSICQIALNHMKYFTRISGIIIALLANQISYSQLVATSNMTVAEYVQDVLLGANVTVSNITFNGASANTIQASVGQFECEDCNLGMESGMIMTSGFASNAVGPNNQGAATGSSNLFGSTDPDLTAISTNTLNDWCIVEFDFVPLGDTLRFNYIFASEEYPEYSGSGFNDVFGFFLSGPGINGPYSNNAENLALIPGTNSPVTINNVNNGGDGINGPCQNCEFYNHNGMGWDVDDPTYSDPYYIQYDGFLDTFEAYSIVQCGQTYHIKLCIADAGDSGFDSGVFLERESFSSNLVVQVEIDFEAGGPEGNTLFEDCGQSLITFSRPESGDLNTALTAYIEYSGDAIELVDYSDLPDSVYFAPGVESISFPLDAYLDFLAEGIETVEMLISNFAQCGETMLESEFIFYINDTADPLVVEGYTESICDGAIIDIEPIISGGYGVYSFDWSTGETSQMITVSPLISTTYNVMVSDTCGMPSDDANIIIEVAEFPPFSVLIDQGDFVVDCFGLQLTATATGGDGNYSAWFWSNDEGNNLWGWQNTLWYGPWNGVGEVTISVEDGCGEITTHTVTATSSITPMQVTMPLDTTVSCGAFVTLDPLVEFGQEPFWFTWYDTNWNYLGSADTYSFTASNDFQIQLYISDNCGGYYNSIININVEPIPMDLLMPGPFTGTCTDVFFIDPEVTGGSGPGSYNYVWTVNGSNVGSNETLAYSSSQSVTVVLNVTDNCNSSATGEVDIEIVNVAPELSLSPDVTVTCVEVGQFTSTVNLGEAPFEYEWTANGVVIGSGDVLEYQADETTSIELLVTDICGLSDQSTVTLFIDNPAIEVVVSQDTSICLGSQITLSVEGSGGAGALVYDWSGPMLSSSDQNVQVSPGTLALYEVSVSDQCNQIETENVEVDVQDVNAGFTLTYLSETEVQFVADVMDDCEDCNYTWNFGDGITSDIANPIHTFDGLAQYQVELYVNNNIGCYDYGYSVVYPPLELYVPNAFTPDGDGINDVFQVYGMGILEYEIIIFSRWGDVVFRSEDLNQAWTGNTKNGEYFIQDGVYTYVIKYQGVSKEAAEISGQILLMR